MESSLPPILRLSGFGRYLLADILAVKDHCLEPITVKNNLRIAACSLVGLSSRRTRPCALEVPRMNVRLRDEYDAKPSLVFGLVTNRGCEDVVD